jgi:predicted phosphodiesterase
MRIAVVSDLHGNLSAFEAVLADLQPTSPDLVLEGGDLADAAPELPRSWTASGILCRQKHDQRTWARTATSNFE